MKTFFLYSENYAIIAKVKRLVKKILGRNFGGPAQVERSLIEGLKLINAPFVFNRPPLSLPVAGVLNGVATLRRLIGEKKQGKICKLIAGPNISLPGEDENIIFDEAIDIILVPSQWVITFCADFRPESRGRLRVWASGVETIPLPETKKIMWDCLIYKKSVIESEFNAVINLLKSKKISYTIIEYGNYTREAYLRLLTQVKFAIFFSFSESQGIALNESWMMDVPTLVWQISQTQIKQLEKMEIWPGSISAPYLSPESGLFFGNADELGQILEQRATLFSQFRPRQYHLENFTLEQSAKQYCSIVESLDHQN